MDRMIAWLVTAAACLTGCQNATPKLDNAERVGVDFDSPAMMDGVRQSDAITTVTQDFSPSQLTSVPVGADCTVQTTTPNRSVHGTIAEVTAAGIVLVDAEETIQAASETAVPVLSRAPYAGRLFKNVGIARESHPVGSVTIPASEIVSARVSQMMQPSTPAN